MDSQALAVVIFFLSAFILGYFWVQCFGSNGIHPSPQKQSGISKSVYRDEANKYVKEGAEERIRNRMQRKR